jgi:hypothetical protein
MPYPEKWLKSALEASEVDAFPLVVPEGTEPPFIVYSRTGTARERDLDGTVGSPVGTFQVEIYADGYLESKEIADLVRAQANNFSGSADGVTIQWSHLAEESDGDPVFLDGRDRPTYLVQQTFEITWEE